MLGHAFLRCFPLFILGLSLLAEDIRFPADSGVVDVTKAPYNAVPDGKTDCTDAIQRALREHPNRFEVIYLPNGTYLVSKRLMWGGGPDPENPDPFGSDSCKLTSLQGQSQAGTIIKLKDSCPGFQEVANPQAVIWTGLAPAQRFAVNIFNLTVDTGSANPGAIGVQYLANNTGCMREVTIRTKEQQPIGLDLGYTDEQGPCLITGVTIEGPFATGISARHGVASYTMSQVFVNGALVGWDNKDQCASAEDYRYVGPGPALINEGFITLFKAHLHSGGPAAIINKKALVARKVTTLGAPLALQNMDVKTAPRPADLPVGYFEEWSSNPAIQLWPETGARAASLDLEVKQTPDVAWESDLTKWISPLEFGAIPDDNLDDSEALQKAIDAADARQATTLYLPRVNRDGRGTYHVAKTVVLRSKSLRRVIGCSAWIYPMEPLRYQVDTPVIRVEGGGEPLIIERLWLGAWEKPTCVMFEDAGDRTLIFREFSALGDGYTRFTSYRKVGGKANELYIEDGSPGNFVTFSKGQKIWARQMNPEGYRANNVDVDGADFWCLGMKLEGNRPAVEVRGGGRAEILGALFYPPLGVEDGVPMFKSIDSQLTCSMGQVVFGNKPFDILVEEIRDGVTRRMMAAQGRPWVNCAAIILFTTGATAAAPGK